MKSTRSTGNTHQVAKIRKDLDDARKLEAKNLTRLSQLLQKRKRKQGGAKQTTIDAAQRGADKAKKRVAELEEKLRLLVGDPGFGDNTSNVAEANTSTTVKNGSLTVVPNVLTITQVVPTPSSASPMNALVVVKDVSMAIVPNASTICEGHTKDVSMMVIVPDVSSIPHGGPGLALTISPPILAVSTPIDYDVDCALAPTVPNSSAPIPNTPVISTPTSIKPNPPSDTPDTPVPTELESSTNLPGATPKDSIPNGLKRKNDDETATVQVDKDGDIIMEGGQTVEAVSKPPPPKKTKSVKNEKTEMPLTTWKGTPEEQERAGRLYDKHQKDAPLLKKPYQGLTGDQQRSYLRIANTLIQLWGWANDPFLVPGLCFPASLKKLIKENQDVLPTSGSTSLDLIEHIFTTVYGNMACTLCRQGSSRTPDGWQKLKERRRQTQEAERQAKLAGGTKPIIRNSKPLPLVSGDYLDDLDKKEPWVLDCGCTFEAACVEFFMWKTWSGKQGDKRELMRLIPKSPREFLVQNLPDLCALNIGDLMNHRGTGFWDLDHQIDLREKQVEVLQDELAEFKKIKLEMGEPTEKGKLTVIYVQSLAVNDKRQLIHCRNLRLDADKEATTAETPN
ncbi:hypothetical protein BDN72DRAFT_903486 [Pluteus cervinus]|uniref:Uncharacterized protein n=1 Tax=Pluteus cervinus TaxID=181527 RepID=A0ACD3A9D4_9AGAR|nr:hypothetical protein BDN72DRAFT_903486 [Pluteus cervinus]